MSAGADINHRPLARRYLLNLGLFKFDVLARNRIIFLEGKLLSRISRVLFGHVVEARACCRKQLNFLCYWLSHGYQNL